MKAITLAAGALLLAGLLAGAAGAQNAQNKGINPSGPLAFRFDGGEVNPDTCITPMRGNAEIRQDGVYLRANTITLYQERGRGGCGDMTKLEARGNVFYVTREQSVRADNADYQLTGNTVLFTGNVVAVRGEDVITGARLEVNTETSAFTSSGGVRGVVHPKGSGQTK